MINQEKISIIVPVYKTEKYLEKCVNSLLNQTYKNIEILLIDDGSPDNSGKICDESALKDERIRVFHKANGGPSSARNLALKELRGEYVTFVDSDDWLEENAIEIMYETIIKNELDVVRTSFFIESENEKNKPVSLPGNISNKKFVSKTFEFEEIVLKNFVNGSLSCYMCMCLIKKEKLINLQPFNEKIFFMEDTLYFIDMLINIDSIYFLDLPLYHYLMNQNGLTKSEKGYIRNINTMPLMLHYFEDIFKNNKSGYDSEKYITIRKSANTKVIMSYVFALYKSGKSKSKFKEILKEIISDVEVYKLLNTSNLTDLGINFKNIVENLFKKLILKQKFDLLIFLYDIRKFLGF